MATVTQHNKSASDPGAIELIEAAGDGLAATGLVLTSFLGAIPGLLPVVLLTIAAGVILLIPALVVGLVIGVVWVIAMLIGWLARRLAALLPGRRGSRQTDVARPAPLHTAVPASQPRPTA